MSLNASIMIPAYNEEDFIARALESSLGQNYSGDCEIVVVNDGSSDGTGKIIEDYRRKFPKTIKPVHQKNGGIGVTRNELLKNSEGRYILGLDADDALFPSSLEKVVDYFESYPESAIVYTDHEESDRNGSSFKEMRKGGVHEGFYEVVLHHNFLGRIVAYNREYTGGCWFDPSLNKSEDYDFLLKVLLSNWNGLQVGHIPETLYSYNREGTGLDDGVSKTDYVLERNLKNYGFYEDKSFYVAKESYRGVDYYEHFVEGERTFSEYGKKKLLDFLE